MAFGGVPHPIAGREKVTAFVWSQDGPEFSHWVTQRQEGSVFVACKTISDEALRVTTRGVLVFEVSRGSLMV